MSNWIRTEANGITGEFAEMNNDLAQAQKMYREAASLAKAIGFPEGQANSQEALKRVSKAG